MHTAPSVSAGGRAFVQVARYGRTVFKSPSGHSLDLQERADVSATSTHPVNTHRHVSATQRHVKRMSVVAR